MCSVYLPEEDRVINVLGEHLEPVSPDQGDKIKVRYSILNLMNEIPS